MKWLFILIVVAVIGYVVYVNQSTPKSPEEMRRAAMTSAGNVAHYYCEAAMRGSAADMDSVCTPQGAGRADGVIQALRDEEKALQTTATEVITAMGGGATSNVRDAKALFRDAGGSLVFAISVIRSEKQDNGEWRITYVTVD